MAGETRKSGRPSLSATAGGPTSATAGGPAGGLAERHPGRRILVRIEAAPAGRGALEMAAAVASMLDAELVGLFVQDADLFSLAGLPFAHEIGLASGKRRSLSVEVMERQLAALTERARRALEEIASRGPLRWTFRTARGSLHAEFISAAGEADLVIAHAASLEWAALKLAARPPIFVLQDGASPRLRLVTLCSPAFDSAGLAGTVCALARGSRDGVDLIGLCEDPALAQDWRAAVRAQLAALGCERQVSVLCAESPEALAGLLKQQRAAGGAGI